MFTYNSTRPPILLKSYGRHLQNFVAEVAKLSEKEQRTSYAKYIIPFMADLVSKKNNSKEECDVAQLWHDLFVISNYTLDVDAPVEMPKKKELAARSTMVSYNTQKNEFKCCGRHLTLLTRALMSQIEELPSPKESLVALVKLMQGYHKKNIPTIISHIEKIANKKVPFSYEEIKPFFGKKDNNRVSR